LSQRPLAFQLKLVVVAGGGDAGCIVFECKLPTTGVSDPGYSTRLDFAYLGLTEGQSKIKVSV